MSEKRDSRPVLIMPPARHGSLESIQLALKDSMGVHVGKSVSPQELKEAIARSIEDALPAGVTFNVELTGGEAKIMIQLAEGLHEVVAEEIPHGTVDRRKRHRADSCNAQVVEFLKKIYHPDAWLTADEIADGIGRKKGTVTSSLNWLSMESSHRRTEVTVRYYTDRIGKHAEYQWNPPEPPSAFMQEHVL